MKSIALIATGVLVFTSYLKYFYWKSIPHKKTKTLLASFIKNYSIYAIHDGQDDAVKTFRSKSNTINIFFWIAVIYLIVYFLFQDYFIQENLL
jgi:hypothetical protein